MQKYFWTVGTLFSFYILQLAGENTRDKIEHVTRLHPLESLAKLVLEQSVWFLNQDSKGFLIVITQEQIWVCQCNHAMFTTVKSQHNLA